MKKFTLLAYSAVLSVLLYAQAPPYQWARQGGGPFNGEVSNAIYVDASGNSYITGTFFDTCRFGSITLLGGSLNPAWYTDVFVAKYDASGNPLWAKSGTSPVDDGGFAVCADNSGNVYVAGYFNRYNNSAITFGSLAPLASVGWDDIFLVKYDANGNEQWAVKAGGSQNDYAYDLVADNNGNVYMVGNCQATCTFGTNSVSSSGWGDVYVAKYNASNGNNIWTVKAGGSGNDEGYGIEMDASGNLYITGFFTGTCTFGSAGALTSSGFTDAFVAKLDNNGNFLWAKKGGGAATDAGTAITLDPLGNVYITGYVDGNATFGTISLTSGGAFDLFAAKYDNSGNVLWAVNDGGIGNDKAYGICRDNQGGIYVTGSYEQTATFGTYPMTVQGISDVFTTKYDPSNGNNLWALSGGAEDQDIAFGIGVDNSDKLYITGAFRLQAFFGSALNASAFDEIFLVKIDNVLSVEDMEANNHYVQLFPNPASALATLSIDPAFFTRNAWYDITDVAGKVVQTEQLGDVSSSVDLSALPAGMYLLKVNTENGAAVKQIIKQ
ncbi:MAG: SBBP repeat-containing protein [Bacteroidota bacterium]